MVKSDLQTDRQSYRHTYKLTDKVSYRIHSLAENVRTEDLCQGKIIVTT